MLVVKQQFILMCVHEGRIDFLMQLNLLWNWHFISAVGFRTNFWILLMSWKLWQCDCAWCRWQTVCSCCSSCGLVSVLLCCH